MSDTMLVLWDIDLTLIRTNGVATEAYIAAVQETIGSPWRGDMTFNGLTERAMATRILRMHDVEPDPELLARFLVNIERALLERAEATKARGFALPGASAALQAVAADPGIRQSVLTGNIRSVAEMKLRAFGLDPWIDFSVGAYGDDEFERNALIPHAWHRAETRYGQTYAPARTVVLGDTVRDVEAALAHDAAVVAVASGTTSGADLRAAGAKVVLDDLTDTGRVIAAIGQASAIAAESPAQS
ncbi:haloacid dehalogenase-like hydrolase [Catenulispora sp. NL8]|uniref:Haloacid dehalogenase-like hydrolase n=1 Tax=Catenulispora pinistramenti TaxID=2705254 RepID=A0ABS5KZC9_9ACTN|nr:HAD family hydrolase [Catenulispora pinistramenti]MBS2551342.1 haloacid dehalogenase-like hydrolase [Catenulispora pinistramenti]